MKKLIISIQVVLLILFFVFLSTYFWLEEIVLLYLFPLLFISIFSGLVILILKILKKGNTKKLIHFSFIGATLLQLLLFVYIVWAISPQSYSKDQVLADIDNAMLSLQDIHPNINAVVDKDRLAQFIDSLKSEIPEKVFDYELFKMMGSITALIGDAHTQLDFDNFTKGGGILFRKVPPYRFKIKEDKIFILKNYYRRNNIPIGSEILSINNKPTIQCLNEISSLLSYETTNYRDAFLQIPVLWGMWNDFEDFEISYKTPDGNIESVKTSSGLIANISYIWDVTKGFGMQDYRFKILEGNIGYIDLRAFGNHDTFKQFAQQTFKSIQQNNIRDLIIDIRENGGGSGFVSEELMQYISAVEYKSFDSSLIKISNYMVNVYGVDTTQFSLGSMVDEEPEMIALRDNPLRFDGNCHVLTSAFNFSTALDFAAMIRCFNVGKIIGQETGGRTTSYGSPQKIKLAETGILLKISCKKFVNPCAIKSDGGLIPDYIVENSIEDDMNGIDRVLDFTIALINK